MSLSRFLLKQSNLRFVIFIIDRISSEQQNTVQWNQEREREREKRERDRGREGGRERETERERSDGRSLLNDKLACLCAVCAWYAYVLGLLYVLACSMNWMYLRGWHAE